MYASAKIIVFLAFCQQVFCCTTEPYCSKGPFGVKNGHEFNDFELFKHTSACSNITRVEVWHDTIVHGLKFTYGSSVSSLRGSDVGEHANHDIGGHWITKVTGQVGQTQAGSTLRITELTLHLNSGTVFGPYGGNGIEQSPFSAESGPDQSAGLSWISGRDGANLDELTFFFNCIL